jgi:hypothetical protein
MIHYHGMAGKGHDEVIALAGGRHIFISYARPNILEMASSICSSFALDNGAFSAWTKGKVIDYDGFIDFTARWSRHPAFDWAVIPDVIDGDEVANDDFLAQWPRQLPGVPVWHLHESLKRLQRLAEEWPRVCLGSSGLYSKPNSKSWWGRISEAMDAVCVDGQPLCKLHGLRMLDPRIFTKLPLSSADSTNAERNAGIDKKWGPYAPPTVGQRSAVIAWRVENQQSAEFWDQPTQMELAL